MPSKRIDLHMHTNCSDGLHTPEEILELVCRRRLAAFSVTDHDTLEGFRTIKGLMENPTDSMQEFLDRVPDIKLISGVELSTMIAKTDIHMLAYAFNPEYKPLNEALDRFQEKRNLRGMEMVQRLSDLGLDVSFDSVLKKAGDGVIGRPHVADVLAESGVVTYEEAFQKYIGKDGPAYVPKGYFTPEEAINLIHRAGGIAVLAHAGVDDTDRYLDQLTAVGLDGIEVFHPRHKQSDVDRYKHLAERYRLIITGGSDFHGREGRLGEIGGQPVPIDLLDRVLQRAQLHRGK